MSPALVRTVLLSCALAAGGASLYQVGAKSSHPHHAPDIPSSPKPGPARGEVISAEALNAAAALPSAARNYLVHYDSRSPDGSDVVVSGTVAIPIRLPVVGR